MLNKIYNIHTSWSLNKDKNRVVTCNHIIHYCFQSFTRGYTFMPKYTPYLEANFCVFHVRNITSFLICHLLRFFLFTILFFVISRKLSLLFFFTQIWCKFNIQHPHIATIIFFFKHSPIISRFNTNNISSQRMTISSFSSTKNS